MGRMQGGRQPNDTGEAAARQLRPVLLVDPSTGRLGAARLRQPAELRGGSHQVDERVRSHSDVGGGKAGERHCHTYGELDDAFHLAAFSLYDCAAHPDSNFVFFRRRYDIAGRQQLDGGGQGGDRCRRGGGGAAHCSRGTSGIVSTAAEAKEE